MATEFFLLTLARAEVAASIAVLAILAVRRGVRRRLDPALTYRLWWAVPIAMAASVLPGLAECLNGGVVHVTSATPPPSAYLSAVSALDFWRPHAQVLLAVWAVGAAAMGLLFVRGEVRIRRDARLGLAGPAVVGVAAPRLVVPSDFHSRFSEGERALIRLHERTHIVQGHPLDNLAVATLQVIAWFNPLMHLAAGLFRFDQELACDALVLEDRRRQRKTYALALLKAQATCASGLSLTSAWASTSRGRLEVRLRMLHRRPSGLWEHARDGLGVAAAGLALALMIWTAIPNPRVQGSGLILQERRPPPVTAAGPS
jgi:beta-lactamase regulating signal transducer with metallopeptidase domain